jgi:peptide/nickel transport system substrate-binding protein
VSVTNFRTRPYALLVAVAVASSFLITACTSGSTSGSNAAAAGGTGGTLIVGMESEADILDPPRTGSWVTTRVFQQIFEGLVGEDLTKPSSEVPVPPLKPELAESWTISPDGKTYTFKIRPGVKFQDGTPLDAAAVEFNIRRMWDKKFKLYDVKSAGNSGFVWQYLSSIETPDPMTLVLKMSKPFSSFLRLLTQGGYYAVISPTALEKYGNDGIADHPIGTGPFTFSNRVRGQSITLVRNDDYWGTKAKLKTVIFRPLPDTAARVTALRAGEVDMIAVPSPDSIAGLTAAGFQISEGTPPHLWFLNLNLQDGPTKDLRVREAINLAINREGMAHDLLKDTASPALSVLPPGNPAAVPDPAGYKYDPEAAKKLLADAGYANGFSTVLTTSVSGSGQILPVQMAEYIQQDLAKVGITAKIDATEWISYLTKWAHGMDSGTSMAQMSWGMSSPYWLYILNSSNLMAPNGPNASKYSNPKLDALMDKAATSADDATAESLWKQAVQMAQADKVIVPVVNDKAPYALSPKVHGFVSPSEEWYDLTTVSVG